MSHSPRQPRSTLTDMLRQQVVRPVSIPLAALVTLFIVLILCSFGAGLNFAAIRGVGEKSPTPTEASVLTQSPPPVRETAPPATTTPLPTPFPTTPSPSLESWRIAFTSDQTGADTIWTMDKDGGSRYQVTSPAFGLSDWYPEWCNSNRTILFERGDHIEGTTNQKLYQASPSAPPGGESPWPGVLADTSLSGAPACAASGRMVLFGAVADLKDWRLFFFDGRKTDVFGPGYEKLASAALSSDGHWVAFSYRDLSDPEGRFRLFKAPITDPYNYTSIQPVGVDNVLAMSWSPDGKWLAYVCRAGNETWQLCISDTNGGALQMPGYIIRYTENSRGTISALAGSPTWSPDGRWVAFASNADGDWDIYVIEVTGSGAKNLTDDWKSNEMMPSWSK